MLLRIIFFDLEATSSVYLGDCQYTSKSDFVPSSIYSNIDLLLQIIKPRKESPAISNLQRQIPSAVTVKVHIIKPTTCPSSVKTKNCLPKKKGY